MKFKKLLSLSAGMVASLGVLGGCGLLGDLFKLETVEPKEPVKTIRFEPRPDLNFKIDTLRLTKENFDAKWRRAAAGQFAPNSNTVRITYFLAETDDPRVNLNCDIANESASVVLRHEMEHARKANIVQDVHWLSGWDRARLAVMNESMAPGGEIIEAVEYHLQTGQRYPQNRGFLWWADSVIMARQAEKEFGFTQFKTVDFSDPVIADVILESSVDEFARDHKRGFYHTKIKKELKSVRRPKYKPHNQCDMMPTASNYLPMANQWGVLWTYDVNTPWAISGKKKVDIWNSATAEARRRVIEKVDSIVQSDMSPGQMLIASTFEYPH